MKRPRAKIIVKALIALTATSRCHAVRIPVRLPISDAASSPSVPTRPTPRLAPLARS